MIETFSKYWPILLAVLQFFTMWVIWSVKKQFVTHDDLSAAVSTAMQSAISDDDEIQGNISSIRRDHKILHERVTEDIDKRMVRLEEGIKHMPKHEDLARLHQRMDDLNTQMQNFNGQFKASSHTLNLIHEYLLKGGEK